jgi:hypothetical protein
MQLELVRTLANRYYPRKTEGILQIVNQKPVEIQGKGAKSFSINMWNISQSPKRTFSLCVSRRGLRMGFTARAPRVDPEYGGSVGSAVRTSVGGYSFRFAAGARLLATLRRSRLSAEEPTETKEIKFAPPTFSRLPGAGKPELSADLK